MFMNKFVISTVLLFGGTCFADCDTAVFASESDSIVSKALSTKVTCNLIGETIPILSSFRVQSAVGSNKILIAPVVVGDPIGLKIPRCSMRNGSILAIVEMVCSEADKEVSLLLQSGNLFSSSHHISLVYEP